MLRLAPTARPVHRNTPQRSGLLSGLVLLTSSSLALLTGCGVTTSPAGNPSSSLAIHGQAFGGAQPLKNSTITLYAASQTGYAGAATALTSTQTDGVGNFDITGTYNCPSNSQVYLTAAGGDPGTGKNNPNLVIAAGLGTCSGTLSPNLFIVMNEVTTVATAYALSAFSTDVLHVGTSATNVLGLSNAMATINNLADTTRGSALSITPAYKASSVANTNTSIAPQATINTLANILSNCVNSSGGTAGDGSTCGNLFASIAAVNPSTGQVGPTTTDTFQAALAIAQHPGQNVAGIYSNIPPLVGSPFTPALTAQPNDWMVSVTYVGGGLGGSTTNNTAGVLDLKVDALGNIWMPASRTNRIIELNNLGAPISPSTTGTAVTGIGGFAGNGLITVPQEIAIDLEGGAWVAQANGNVSALDSTGTPLLGSPFSDQSMPNASGITIDGFDNVWVPSNKTNAVVKMDHTGAFLSGVSGFTGNINLPTGAIGIDQSENAFVINGNGSITELTNAGSVIGFGSAGQKINGPNNKLALDGLGHEFVVQPGVSNTILRAGGTSSGTLFAPYSVFAPTAVAIDGAANVWATNEGGQPKGVPQGPRVPSNLIELTNTGTNLAPANTGFLLNYPTDSNPQGVGIDGSGNVWVANFNSVTGNTGASDVQEFIGAAVPTVTPISVAVKNNTLGTRP